MIHLGATFFAIRTAAYALIRPAPVRGSLPGSSRSRSPRESRGVRIERKSPTTELVAGLDLKWSGRLDLNQRPPAPEAGALPGYATPRCTENKQRERARRDSNSQPSDP